MARRRYSAEKISFLVERSDSDISDVSDSDEELLSNSDVSSSEEDIDFTGDWIHTNSRIDRAPSQF